MSKSFRFNLLYLIIESQAFLVERQCNGVLVIRSQAQILLQTLKVSSLMLKKKARQPFIVKTVEIFMLTLINLLITNSLDKFCSLIKCNCFD